MPSSLARIINVCDSFIRVIRMVLLAFQCSEHIGFWRVLLPLLSALWVEGSARALPVSVSLTEPLLRD